MLCWVLLGKPYPLTNLTLGGNCMNGYTSHYVVVNDKYHPKQDHESVYGDEIVIFKPAHVLPRFIVKYSIEKL